MRSAAKKRFWIVLALAWSLAAPAASVAARRVPPQPETAKLHGGDYWLGKEIYEEVCFSCHGVKGDGKGPKWRTTRPRPQVFTSPYMKRMTDDYIFATVKFGKMNVLKNRMRGHKVQNGVPTAMPSFGEALEDGQIRGLIRWARGLARGERAGDGETREIFMDACAACHGKRGAGDGARPVEDQDPGKPFVSHIQPPPMNYLRKEQMARFDDAFLFWLIRLGRIDATEVKKFADMQAYGHLLDDKKIWSVVRYVREAFINAKPRKGR